MAKRDPLDGSTSGTIGGGGRESGGPTPRPEPPDIPDVNPEDAASGRRAPDALGSTASPDPMPVGVEERPSSKSRGSASPPDRVEGEMKPGPEDVSDV